MTYRDLVLQEPKFRNACLTSLALHCAVLVLVFTNIVQWTWEKL